MKKRIRQTRQLNRHKVKVKRTSNSNRHRNTSKLQNQKAKIVKTKVDLIYDVLKRWWFVLPDWPPVDYDYTTALEENKLRVVAKISWKI